MLAAAILTAPAATATLVQGSCDAAVAARASASAWDAYRANDMGRADTLFRSVRRACPRDAGALTGLGYIALRRNLTALAIARFDSAIALAPESYDALAGRGMAAWRAGRTDLARRSFARALQVHPGDSISRAYLARLAPAVDTTPLPPRARPAETQVTARAANRVLEVPDGQGGWRPFWVKAVNVGAALPGRHPSEFPPDDSTYERWIALSAAMGANTLRVYTIHPPHFYRALARWNREHADAPMRLLHGIWTELPPGPTESRYDDAVWRGAFVSEMRRVVDLVHGNAVIRPRPGHASGRYDTDVSPWLVGYIVGREWEPHSVVAYVKEHPGVRAYTGTYVSSQAGNAMDAWMARFCDELVSYSMARYNSQQPVAYTNWPTLDPLHHPTEATRAEQAAILRQRGEVLPERDREYDNDAIGLDATKHRATARFHAGVFASYHAYPYYPDFMVVDPAYRAARSPEGPSAYFGYLRELVEYHGSMPVIISEYGVPSSRGNAHVQPEGWNHGGHSEGEQAAINARLTRDIYAAGAAGAGLFALIDEWFKKNWLVIDFEQPADRNRLWLNALDPEQHYGVIAMRPGDSASAITVDGRRNDWGARRALLARSAGAPRVSDPLRLDSLAVAHDEAYVYLRLDVGALDWSRANYLIGIDTYRRDLGDMVLPRTRTRSPVGLEFVVDLRGPRDSRVLVDHPYNLYRMAPIRGPARPDSLQIYNTPFKTVANAAGRWDTLFVVTNRRRYGRDGTKFPAIGYDRNALTHARQDSTSLADWYADATTGVIEVRIPWGMLHVLDPSSRTVLFGSTGARDPAGAATDGFRFVVESYDPARPAGGGDILPREDSGAWALPPLWTWPGWEAPRWHAVVKPQFEAMREAFASIPESGRRP